MRLVLLLAFFVGAVLSQFTHPPIYDDATKNEGSEKVFIDDDDLAFEETQEKDNTDSVDDGLDAHKTRSEKAPASHREDGYTYKIVVNSLGFLTPVRCEIERTTTCDENNSQKCRYDEKKHYYDKKGHLVKENGDPKPAQPW